MQRDADLERHEHLGTDLLAHRVHIVDLSGEAIGPDDCTIAGVHELDDDDESPGRDLDRAPEAIADGQQAPDLAKVRVGRAQAKG